jgi:hypothetical protein
MTPEEMLQEEANIGAELLKSIKKRCIEQNTWTDFTRLKHVLAGGKPDRVELSRSNITGSNRSESRKGRREEQESGSVQTG